MKLFDRDNVVGIFRGFSEGGLEFHADLVLPYRNEFQSAPMHGRFVLVQLEGEDEAVLGRITSISSLGRLVSGTGEDYSLRAAAEDRPIPEDLREQYLKYQVDIRVLGVVRTSQDNLVFAPSHRRLPHVGSKVAFLSSEVTRAIAAHELSGAELGFMALGEFVYCGDDSRFIPEPWMVPCKPSVIPRFDVKQLVARRSFVFARAGFGKSNLVKLLFSSLYKQNPEVEKRGGRHVPVGTIIFDPDGEYFWPDDKNRPGLCDVPELQDKIVVFTRKAGPSPYYQSFIAGDIKLDIRRLRPADVLSIALSPEKQDQQNVRKLKGLNDADWKRLVDEVFRNKNAADGDTIKKLLRLEDSQEAEMVAARANMTAVINMLHDPSSQMLDMLLCALRDGKICIVDVSQMRGTPALVLSGLILQRIFDYNQDEFTKANPQTIPTIAVVEEAQSVLGSSGSSGEGPYVSWVKEGRKYDLGAVLITQQPGSISNEILSQGDNWFVFHLLAAGDLGAVKHANAHFSDDLLSSLLNEPIPGHCVFWSSSGGKPYPLPIRVLSFEHSYKAADSAYDKPALATYASRLKSQFGANIPANALENATIQQEASSELGVADIEEPADALEMALEQAIEQLASDSGFKERVERNGIPWMGALKAISDRLPPLWADRDQVAHAHVPRLMDRIFGKNQWGRERRESKSGSGTTLWIVIPPA